MTFQSCRNSANKDLRLLCALLLSVPLLFASACGGGGSGNGGGSNPPPQSPTVTSVSVTCPSLTVPTSQSSQCSAAVTGTGSYSSTVNWAVDAVQGGSATVGSINSAGLYSAPSAVPTPYTVSVTATSIQDASKSASVQMVIAGVIASTSQAIAASTGGSVSLTDGSSVTIAPGTLSADTTITLSKVSVPSSQPNNSAIGSVGPALVLGFSSPAHFLFRSGSGERLATPDALPEGAFSSSLHFVINVAGNISASLTNSVPMAGLIRSTNGAAASFVGGIGSFDATAQTVTGDISGYALQAASVVTGTAVAIELTAQNFIQAKLQTYLPQNSWALNVVPSNLPADTWQSYSGCPTGKTLLVVHGMNSSVTETYKTTDSTIQNIKKSGGYDSVVGYDYDWTNAIDTSGAYVAAFLNTLAQCSGVDSIDIEAHSEGVAVTLSALTDVSPSTRQEIKHMITVAGPIMGTPMANTADLAGYLASQPGAVVAFGLASQGLAYVLSQPFVADLVVSVPGDNSKLDIIRRTVSPYSSANAPQIFVVAGDSPGSMQTFAYMMSLNGVNYSDGFIPLASALAFQNNSSNLPVLKVYPLPPFPGNHTELISNSSLVGPSVAHAVGAQINTSASSPALSLSSIPSCTNSILCSGTSGTYFSLGGSGLTSNDNYALYQQDDTGNVSSPPLAANFIASNATVPPNTWQDTPSCGVAPRTLVLFAQDTNSNSLLASNAVTEQVVAGTCVAPVDNPVPTIATPLVPASLSAGSAAHTLTINGTGFLTSSTVTFKGISHVTTYGGGSQLTISLTSADLATAGTYPVVVTNPSPGGGSATATFTVTATNNPVPAITSLAPASLAVNSAPQTLAINGTGFLSSSTVTFNGISHAVAFVSASQLTISLTSADLATAGSYSVVVTNPSPGGGASTAANFSVVSGKTAGDWTWTGGASTTDELGVYGTQGVQASTNIPGAREGTVSWTDSIGNLWLFGGYGHDSVLPGPGGLNDLWEFSPESNTWTWISGSATMGTSGGQPGVYGTQGVSASSNFPGGRENAVSWIDGSDDLWLFGGFGFVSGGSYYLNDLWKFSPTSNLWTWVSGSDTGGQTGIYGTQGVPAVTNVPGARYRAVSWADKKGNLWLFGGLYLGPDPTYWGRFNDLWLFTPSTNMWTWISGSSDPPEIGGRNHPGIYGTKGVPATTNVPGAREAAVSWMDNSGNLWLFGGFGESLNGFGYLNDLWKFDPALGANGEWTWMGGSSTLGSNCPIVNGNPYCGHPGVYGTRGVPGPANVSGGRWGAASWVDASGNLWLFGGWGMDSTGTFGVMNDMWMFNPGSETWTWINGPDTVNQPGVYGQQGVPAATDLPPGRAQSAGWTDTTGAVWLFGGSSSTSLPFSGYLNDLWRYQP